jgi:hypothetical protein
MYFINKNSKLSYTIELNNSSSIIIKSINSLSFLNKKIKNQEIEIYTNNIQPIKPKQNHEMIYKLIQCLCEQQEHLQSIGYSFYTFHLEDIIITDNNFFCVNDRNICKLTNKNTFSLFFPFSKDSFLSPELLTINQLPNHKINISSFYYSLGSLAYYSFFESNVTEDTFEENMNTIIHTPIFWFFKKTLRENPNNRFLFLIT